MYQDSQDVNPSKSLGAEVGRTANPQQMHRADPPPKKKKKKHPEAEGKGNIIQSIYGVFCNSKLGQFSLLLSPGPVGQPIGPHSFCIAQLSLRITAIKFLHPPFPLPRLFSIPLD